MRVLWLLPTMAIGGAAVVVDVVVMVVVAVVLVDGVDGVVTVVSFEVSPTVVVQGVGVVFLSVEGFWVVATVGGVVVVVVDAAVVVLAVIILS